jgi:hypothetical protein
VKRTVGCGPDIVRNFEAGKVRDRRCTAPLRGALHRIQDMPWEPAAQAMSSAGMTIPGRAFHESNEKRAYYRLLRYLLSEEVEASYRHDEEKPVPPEMVNLLQTLEKGESSERH